MLTCYAFSVIIPPEKDMSVNSPDASEVFSRQYLLEQIGRAGQHMLLISHAAVVGAGAVGARIAELLVRSGVGRLTIIDRDFVDFSNLTRQALYTWKDAENAIPKAEAARRRLIEIMPTCQVFPRIIDLNPDNIHFILKGADIICDGTDNMETRYLINDWCISENVPWVYSGAVGVEGSTFPVLGRHGCLRCIFPNPPPSGTLPTCDVSGVLGTATSLTASHAATLAIRIILNDLPDPVLTTWNAWNGTQSSISLKKLKKVSGSQCRLCNENITEFLDSENTDQNRALCGRDMVQVNIGSKPDLKVLEKSLSKNHEVINNGFLLKFEADGHVIHIFEDGRAMVKGTRDISVARSLIDKWIGK